MPFGDMPSTLFTPAESRALAPEERLTCLEWNKRYRYIVSRDSADYGRRFRIERVPYLAEILECFSDPTVDTVVFMKPARVGGSEAIRCAISYWTDQSPGPMLLVYPTEPSAREQLDKEVRPLLEDQPRLKRHLTGRPRDLTSYILDTNQCRIYCGWAGSPQSLASRTIQYVLLDEVDKFPPFSGRDASPSELAKRRVQTYGDRSFTIITSTPTVATGAIAVEWENTVDRRFFHVPCPHCDAYQQLEWSMVKWAERADETRKELANRLDVERDVWIECQACKRRIREAHKREMLAKGEWVSEGYPRGQHPASRRRGYHISALYSLLGVTWAKLAAEWVIAQGDVGKLMEFTNQSLGWPYNVASGGVESGALRKKIARGARRGVVPRWAGTLAMSIDTQASSFFWVLRAYGKDERSRQIERGQASSFDEIEEVLYRRYPIDGHEDLSMEVQCACIDSGGGGVAAESSIATSRTDEVYRWCQGDPGRRIPVKGHGGKSRPSQVIANKRVEYTPKGSSNPYEVILHVLDTQYLKDLLAGKIKDTGSEWELCDVDPEYERHMDGEHKSTVRTGGNVEVRWVKKTPGADVDYWDAEVYALALGKILQTHMLPDEDELERQRSARKRPPVSRGEGRFSRTPDGRPFLARK